MKWRFRYYSGLAVVFLFIVISVGFSGCGSSAGKKYYQLSLAPVAAGPGFIDKSVMIGPVVVEDIYNDYRVVYRTSRYQLNFYSYHFWIKKPDKMVRDVIGDYFRDGGVFREVVSGLARGEPDLVLSVGVRVMEEFDSPGAWFAHLRMDIRVEEYKSKREVLVHSFNRQKRLPYKKVGQIPIAISSILKEELEILVEKLKKHLPAGHH